jgi:hypothetical protein
LTEPVQTVIRLPTQRELIQDKYSACDMACRLNDHAHDLAKDGKINASVVALRRAHALEPDHPIVLSCLGAVLFDSCEYTEAETHLRRSISIEPEYAPAHGNLGAVLGAQGKYPEAKASYRRSIQIEPDYSDARWNFAMCLLDSGDWTEAWPYYEARKERGGKRLYPQLPYPEWKGEDLNGKTLYVQGEQGVGDRTLFSRYLVWVKDSYPACRILFMHNAEDLPNISNFMWGYRDIIEFIPNAVPWPEADYGIYLMSLPALHGTTPDNIYPEPGLILKNAMRHKESVTLPGVDKTMLKVGITWTGNPLMKRNGERSIPLDQMLTLATLPNVVLYGLQMGTPDIRRLGADQLICDLSPDIKPLGFTGTAATMLNLDLVITCCTATAHVAGALGVPCWTLLCANAYWLWLRERSDSVWYPNTRLFRQKTMGDWSPVIDEVKSELERYSVESVRKAA